MQELQSLVYVSSAVRPLSRAETDVLLDRSRERNRKASITGVLLYSHGNFMQCLEGPPEAVRTLYEAIKVDPIHRNVTELFNARITAREFSEWSMAFRSICAFGVSNPAELDALFSTRAGAARGPAHALLAKFWNKGIGPGGIVIERTARPSPTSTPSPTLTPSPATQL
jgi:Sensors of blue-light using FAD